jgi:hypothetical protein
MSEDHLVVNVSLVEGYSKKKRRKAGIVWFLIGVSFFIVKKIIRVIDLNLMMEYGIDKGISSSPLGFLCVSVFWAAVITLCFTISFMLFFFDFDKLKEKFNSLKNAEDADSNNSVHY